MLSAWATLLAADLWQAALRSPGSLTPTGVLWLAALYLAATVSGGLVLRGVLRRSAGTTFLVLVGAGLAAGATEAVLRATSPHATTRPLAVAAAIAVGVGAALCLRRLGRMAGPFGLAGALAIAIVVGAIAATGLDGRATSGRPPHAPPPIGRPSFLVVVIDTLRADHLGCYGYGRPTSPVLDRLAASGILYERAYAQSSWTKPSTASLLTGRAPSQHRALSETSRLPESETTIAERLRDLGYRTAALSANPWITPEYGFDQGFDDFYSVYDERFARVPVFMQVLKRASQLTDGKGRLYNRVKYLVLGELSTTARDTRLADEAIRILGAHGKEPFFLYVHMMSPHHPYDPPPPFDRFVPDRGRAPVKNHPRKSYRFFEGGDPLPPADSADLIARYDGDVLYADTELGRVLAELERLGLASSTAVLVTADHGEEFYDHGNWGHGQSVYDELVRVPLLLRVPGAPEARRVATPVSHAAVLPTLLALAGAPAAAPSLLASADDAGGGAPPLAELLYRYGEARALVDGTRKLVVLHDGEQRSRALFDLASDPGERRPLPPDDPDTGRLASELARRVGAAERDRAAATDAAVDDETRARLRGLGYVD